MKKRILHIKNYSPPQEDGWLDIKLSKTVMNKLNQYISVANISKKEYLIGHISKSLVLIDEENWFLNNCLIDALTFYNQKFPTYELPVLTSNVPYCLSSFWVNFQKQYEFNPVHDHSGVYSFVIFVKIPTDWREQHDLPMSKESNEPMASDFSFVYTNMLGRTKTTLIPLDPTSNGRMLFFPAGLHHTVYPFYNCEEERITISGNIKYYTNPLSKEITERKT